MPGAWELFDAQPGGILPIRSLMDRKFLAVLIPHTGEMSADFCYRLSQLHLPPGSGIFMSKEIPLDVSRENMIRRALDLGFEWFLFLDSDIILPQLAIEELLSVHKPIVTGLYRTKKKGNGWSIWNEGKDKNGKDTLLHIDSWTEKIITCDAAGMGCMLIQKCVFEDMFLKFPKLPWFFWSINRNPGFIRSLEVPDPHMRHVGEDIWFCLLTRACGYKINANTEIKCTHIGTCKIKENEIQTWNY